MALRLKVLKNVPPNQISGAGEGSLDAPENPILDPGEGTSNSPKAEARRRDHIYNQSALQGW